MMKRVLIVAIVSLVCLSVMAEQRTEGEIKYLAQTALQQQAASRGQSSNAALDLQIVERQEGITIVSGGASGFAVITNDDEQVPVVGYSLSAYDADNLPDGFRWWKQAINEVMADGAPVARAAIPSGLKPTVEPLLKTTWNQWFPYNEKCPTLDGEHYPTGCGATAMAQVLYYYRYPYALGYSSDLVYATFEWGNMLPDYGAGTLYQREAVATLMYECGKATNAEYHMTGTLISLPAIANALKSFGYANAYTVKRNTYEGDWTATLLKKLSAGHPIIYAGWPEDGHSNPGHIFVLDGYDANGNVHVNWGWGGEANGYFSIDALNPAANFSASQVMIVIDHDYQPQPELATETITISGSRLPGAAHTLKATVINRGTDFSGKLYFFVSNNSQRPGTLLTQQSASIASGGSLTLTKPYTPTANGKYYFWLTADSEGNDVVGKIALEIGDDQQTIPFADSGTEHICSSLFDTNGDNAVSYKEAAAVTDKQFCNEPMEELRNVTSFNELQYFTSLTRIPVMKLNPEDYYRVLDDYDYTLFSALTAVTLPPGVKSIDGKAFRWCHNLETVTFTKDSQLEEIGAHAFQACEKLKNLSLPQGLRIIGDSAFLVCKALETVIIPQALQTIGDNAFERCTSLKEVNLNEGLKSIGDKAFAGCDALNEVVIPASLERLGSHAFYSLYGYLGVQNVYVKWTENPYTGTGDEFDIDWTSLARLHVPLGTHELYQNVLPWKNFNTIVEEAEVSDDPNIINFEDAIVRGLCIAAWDADGDYYLSKDEAAAVTDLGEVFKDNEDIETFHELKYFTGLTSIADQAFGKCRYLETITLPATVKRIEDAAFEFCSRLKAITIPNTVTSIGDCAFWVCSDLATVILGSSVTSIGRSAFNYCGSLTTVYVQRPVPVTISESTFSNRTNATLYVPFGSKGAYEAAKYWQDFSKIVEIAKGDVNCDGSVDIADAVCIVNQVVGKTTPVFMESVADVNDDGDIDIADAVKIVNLVVGKIDALSRPAKEVKDEK
jgi:Peptidase C10 family.